MTKKTKKEIQILLNKSVQNLGLKGSLIKVKSGYARNYLLPLDMAVLANPTILEGFEREQKKIYLQQQKEIASSITTKNILEKEKHFSLEKRVGHNNRIFGTITSKQILDALSSKTGLSFSKSKIKINAPEIKELGTFLIDIVLHPKVIAKVNLEIVAK